MNDNRRPVPRKVENLDDLFLLNTPAAASNESMPYKAQVTLKISLLIPFENHPFKLYDGERLSDMVESIKELGVILPVIVRPKGNETYEILSGHNRVNAAELAGLIEVPVIIKENLTDDEALLIVTETNLIQRSFTDLLHSERAKALSEHHKALSSQGKRTDLLNEIEKLANTDEIGENSTCSPVGKRSTSLEKTGNNYSLSKNTVARYLRINKLIKPLKDRLDTENISIRTAYDLSFLDEQAQDTIEKVSNEYSFKIDMKAAETLRTYFDSKKLNDEMVYQILSGEINKKVKTKTPEPYKLKNRVYAKYFSPKRKALEVEEIIDKALVEYFTNHPDEREEEFCEKED